jgi:pilus assembly protein Flp/PilA
MKQNIITRILKDESGATAIEYGLVVAMVSMAAIVGYQALGTSINDFFNAAKGKLDAKKPVVG